MAITTNKRFQGFMYFLASALLSADRLLLPMEARSR
jgi:hypothetical protein